MSNMGCPVCKVEGGFTSSLPVSFRLCKEHGVYNVLNNDGSFNLILEKINKELQVKQ